MVISEEPASVSELMKKLKLKHHPSFLRNYLRPALEPGLIAMTDPAGPRSPKQNI